MNVECIYRYEAMTIYKENLEKVMDVPLTKIQNHYAKKQERKGGIKLKKVKYYKI
jgi:hypothetical protein